MENTSFSSWLSRSLYWPICVSGIITGKRRGGKTTVLLSIREHFDGPVFTLFPRAPRRTAWEMIRLVESRGFTGAVSTSSPDEYRRLLSSILGQREPIESTSLFFVDEAHRYVTSPRDPIVLAVQEGRHHNISIFVATQRIQGLPGNLVTNTDVQVVGYSENPNDVEYWNGRGITVPTEPFRFKVSSDDGEWSIFTSLDGKITEGRPVL